MEISEARMQKIDLEKCIAGLLTEYEERTGAVIKHVEIESLDEKNVFQDSRHKTTIRIEL